MNRTFATASDEAHFQRCWRLQTCGDCMTKETDCSWCPFSWACVHNPYQVPLLAPAYDEEICPHWAERWELRTRPLGCQVSTITTLTSIVTIFSTIVLFLLLFLLLFLFRISLRYHRAHSGWWRFWSWDWKGTAAALRDCGASLVGRLRQRRKNSADTGEGVGQSDETAPLLPS